METRLRANDAASRPFSWFLSFRSLFTLHPLSEARKAESACVVLTYEIASKRLTWASMALPHLTRTLFWSLLLPRPYLARRLQWTALCSSSRQTLCHSTPGTSHRTFYHEIIPSRSFREQSPSLWPRSSYRTRLILQQAEVCNEERVYSQVSQARR